MKQYYLIDKEIIDSWVNYIERFPLYPEDKEQLQSLTQQSELVEVDEKFGLEQYAKFLKGYKLIKTIK